MSSTPENTPALQRSIGLARATAMVVGIIIGASIFVQPSLITGQMHTVRGVLLVWAAAGALTLIGSLIIAELSSAWPRSGGVYVFLKETYSPAAGFLWGWAMFWSMHSGIVAAIAVVFARYVGTFVALGAVGTKVIAILAILLLSVVNYLGVRHGSAVQATVTLIKVLAIILIIGIAFGIHSPDSVTGAVMTPERAAALQDATRTMGQPVSAQAVVAALIAGLFAFGGWHMVSYSAGETIDPTRTIPRALFLGTATVTILYIALNAAYLKVLPLPVVSTSTAVAADFANAAFGGHGAELMSALVIVSTFGAMNGVILAGPRVYMAMAEDGLLFRWVGDVHSTFRTPHRAIALQAIWSAVLVATGTYRVIFTRVVYTEWIFFGMLAVGVIILRRRKTYAPAYRMWGYPVLPALFVVATAYIVINQIIAEPIESATGLALVLAGLPVYLLWTVWTKRAPQRRSTS